MKNELATANLSADAVERALILQDLSGMNPNDRLAYYKSICESLGLNPLTRPFAYINLNGKLTLYALKDCTEQLRNIHGVSIEIKSREVVEGIYVVVARAQNKHGRCDESIGAVNFENLRGEAKANAMMKAETKAKQRVTLSICGLGMLDEIEVETIPNATRVDREEEARRIVMGGGDEIDLSPEQATRLEAKRAEAANSTALAGARMVEPAETGKVTGEAEKVAGEPPASAEQPPSKPAAPAKKTTRAKKEEKSDAPTEPEPETAPAAEPAKFTGWRAHVIKQISIPKYNGKQLGELLNCDISILFKGWVEKYAEEIAKKPEKKAEAAAISAGFKELFHSA